MYLTVYRNAVAHSSDHQTVSDKNTETLTCLLFMLRRALFKMSPLFNRIEKEEYMKYRKKGLLRPAGRRRCAEVCPTGLCADNQIDKIEELLPSRGNKLKRIPLPNDSKEKTKRRKTK